MKEITPKPTKLLTIEFPKMMYTGKGRVSINGVPYKVSTVQYMKKVRDERTGIVTNNNMQIKSIGRKRMVKHKLILINMNPSIGNKEKSYRVHAIKAVITSSQPSIKSQSQYAESIWYVILPFHICDSISAKRNSNLKDNHHAGLNLNSSRAKRDTSERWTYSGAKNAGDSSTKKSA
jgi:hypothetical protein